MVNYQVSIRQPIYYKPSTLGCLGLNWRIDFVFLLWPKWYDTLGFSLIFSILFYFLLSVGITRVRAEVGPPTNEVSATPHHFLVDLFCSRRLAPPTLTMMSLYGAFNRGSRAHVMPHLLEGFKAIDTNNLSTYRVVMVMLLATVVGILSACWTYLDVGYQIGVNSDL